MNGTGQAGLGYLALEFILGVFLIRWALTGGQHGQHRARRPRPVAVEVPAYQLVPARQLAAHCPGCGTHITINTTGGPA